MSTSFESRDDPRPLIICRQPDPHVTAVLEHLNKAGYDATVWDLNSPGAIRVSPLFLNQDSFEFSAVWWRYKQTPREYAGVASNPEQFAAREWLHYLKALAIVGADAVWVNDPWLASVRSNKFLNLSIASNLGWLVPETLVTNALEDATEFINRFGSQGTIYKVLSYYFDTNGQTIFTSEIGVSDILSHPHNLRMAPVQLQEKIHKKYELRVTVVGEEVFAAKISSQASSHASLDWRRDQEDCSLYEAVKLPSEWIRSILELHEAFGLYYGAYDFICNDRDQLVFLEVNPGGQYLWVEMHTGLPISRAVAEALVKPRQVVRAVGAGLPAFPTP